MGVIQWMVMMIKRKNMMMINEGGDSVKTISLLQNLPSSRRSLHKMTGFELFYPKNPPKLSDYLLQRLVDLLEMARFK